ncbi:MULTISPECIES: hypothetical protein [Clostridium]|nr:MULTISPECIES: hypothetical protein [Clostridium]MCD2345912.1 hypothetical protein [Clostridium guangxiense]
MNNRQNAKDKDSEPKRVKSEAAYEEAVEDKVEKRNMTYEKDDFLKDKV